MSSIARGIESFGDNFFRAQQAAIRNRQRQQQLDWTAEDREQARRQREAEAELAGAMSSSPLYGGALPVPSTPTPPPAAPAPTPAAAPTAIPVSASVGPEAPEPEGVPSTPAEIEAQAPAASKTAEKIASSGKPLNTRDWALWRQSVMRAAAKTGDPDAVAKANKFVTDVQHQGFMRYASMANSLVQGGDYQQALPYVKKAYEFMPDGYNANFQVTPKGIAVSMTSEADGSRGGIFVINKQSMDNLIQNFSNPAKFAQWNREQEVAQANKDREFERGVEEFGIQEGRRAREAGSRQADRDRRFELETLKAAEQAASREAGREIRREQFEDRQKAIQDRFDTTEARRKREFDTREEARRATRESRATTAEERRQAAATRRAEARNRTELKNVQDQIQELEEFQLLTSDDPNMSASVQTQLDTLYDIRSRLYDQQAEIDRQAGASGVGEYTAADAPAAGDLKPGDIVAGSRFKGGNPADPASWETL